MTLTINPSASRRRLVRNIVAVAAILPPYGYFGMLLGVAVHEVVGHGLTSLALGGDFIGFELHYDGMGWATVPMAESAPVWKQVLRLSAGIAATTFCSIAMIVAGYLSRRRASLALPLLVVAFAMLLDGIPYAFWNAVRPVPPGDVGRIIELTGSVALRVSIIIMSGALMVVGIWLLSFVILGVIQSWITRGEEFTGTMRIVILLLLGVVPGAAWFTFDWNQLISGIGALPNVVGAMLHVIAALSLIWIRPASIQPKSGTIAMTVSIVTGWILAGVSVLGMALWFRDGVYWSD